ncbi:hypothetical protein RIF29_20474 [Crotalaria pallida]|uniref:C2H2-type domain-containing protein n=1 Tax=Crotalaria pallida TaxID=3830 RepID=A0AAN9F5N7_CROPI
MQIIKGKRTKRRRLAVAPSSASCSQGTELDLSTTTSPESSIDQFRYKTQEQDEDMANCLILLAQGKLSSSHPPPDRDNNNNNSGLELYRCKTCDRSFPSFQALGGHRSSHKKPNKANAIGTDEKQAITTNSVNEDHRDHYDDVNTTSITTLSLQISNRPLPLYKSSSTNGIGTAIAAATKSRVHECSFCGAEFSSGQALGGHMRRHRTSISNSTTTTTTVSIGGGNINPESQEAKKQRNILKLDLNLPAPDDDQRDSLFSFQGIENVIVFSAAPSMVDCHY